MNTSPILPKATLPKAIFPKASFVPQAIVGFVQDELADWVAVLACGHTQHVRHSPPWQNRPWVQTEKGRASMLGQLLNCKRCVEPA